LVEITTLNLPLRWDFGTVVGQRAVPLTPMKPFN
jgi:hypothetical protein